MSFWRSTVGAALGATIVLLGVVGGFAAVRVERTISPPRQQLGGIDFESVLLQVDDVRFESVDGVSLAGWLLPGEQGRPPIVLCHDLGSSRTVLINLAIALHAEGFEVLLFDFRGHGDSGGRRSTLGLKEKRDILGALDFLERRDVARETRVGIYGVGMGAHAAVLAAADRPTLKVLVLDALYPDASYALTRGFYSDWEPGVRHLSVLPSSLFTLFSGTRIGEQRAADVLAELWGRDLLLLAPAGDAALTQEMQRMYDLIPEQPDVDGNLVLLPAAQSRSLQGEPLARHHARVTEFFAQRL